MFTYFWSDSTTPTDKNTLHPGTKKFRKQIPTMLRSSSSHVCITPLRMLLKRKTDIKAYEKITLLKDHLEERNDKFQHVGIQMLNVVMLLQEACSQPQFTNQEIQRMIGILRTNGTIRLLKFSTNNRKRSGMLQKHQVKTSARPGKIFDRCSNTFQKDETLNCCK